MAHLFDPDSQTHMRTLTQHTHPLTTTSFVRRILGQEWVGLKTHLRMTGSVESRMVALRPGLDPIAPPSGDGRLP